MNLPRFNRESAAFIEDPPSSMGVGESIHSPFEIVVRIGDQEYFVSAFADDKTQQVTDIATFHLWRYVKRPYRRPFDRPKR